MTEYKLLPVGRYIIAVSGGVDSVVLLNMLSKYIDLELIVAHFDHGIREDSAEDLQFVKKLAEDYGYEFAYDSAQLGATASEALARERRYEFLYKAMNEHGADAIVTAHHQDDLVETAAINILRGTGRRGASSLRSTDTIKRPLLDLTKAEILAYATVNQLKWQEDPSNTEQTYLRNRVRHKLAEVLIPEKRSEILRLLDNLQELNNEIDETLDDLLAENIKEGRLNRNWFISLPHLLAKEVLAQWFRTNGIGFDSVALERLTIGVKTTQNGMRLDISGGHYLCIVKDLVGLE